MAEAISVGDASAHFLNAIEAEKAREERAEIDRFVEWLGADHPMADLSAEQIGEYLRERFPEAFATDDEPAELDDEMSTLLEPLRAFLAYASRLAFTEQNLVPALRLREGGGGARGGAGAAAELGGAYYVTIEGLELLERELDELKGRRPEIADSLRAAMADKGLPRERTARRRARRAGPPRGAHPRDRGPTAPRRDHLPGDEGRPRQRGLDREGAEPRARPRADLPARQPERGQPREWQDLRRIAPSATPSSTSAPATRCWSMRPPASCACASSM